MLLEIAYLDHDATAPRMAAYMGRGLDCLPERKYAAVDQIAISTHNGTHLDAPSRYRPTMNHALASGRRCRPTGPKSCAFR